MSRNGVYEFHDEDAPVGLFDALLTLPEDRTEGDRYLSRRKRTQVVDRFISHHPEWFLLPIIVLSADTGRESPA